MPRCRAMEPKCSPIMVPDTILKKVKCSVLVVTLVTPRCASCALNMRGTVRGTVVASLVQYTMNGRKSSVAFHIHMHCMIDPTCFVVPVLAYACACRLRLRHEPCIFDVRLV